jgi:hypothetical protein
MLTAAIFVGLTAGCSVSLADTSPDLLRYCRVANSTVFESGDESPAGEGGASSARADADCIPEAASACPIDPKIVSHKPGSSTTTTTCIP